MQEMPNEDMYAYGDNDDFDMEAHEGRKAWLREFRKMEDSYAPELDWEYVKLHEVGECFAITVNWWEIPWKPWISIVVWKRRIQFGWLM